MVEAASEETLSKEFMLVLCFKRNWNFSSVGLASERGERHDYGQTTTVLGHAEDRPFCGGIF